MNDFLTESLFFAVAISLAGYEIGELLKRKTGLVIFNPLLIAIIFVIGFLLLFHVDYETYAVGGDYLSYLLTPSTVALAIPLYRQLAVLKKEGLAIGLGIVSGVICSLFTTLLLAIAFGLTHTEYVTLLPKSITTAIGMGMSEEMSGMVTITVAAIIVTGIVGNMVAPLIFRLFHIDEKVAQGLALGTSAHAIGTAKAIELGELEGAMSGLSIVVAGILTVIGANVFVLIY